MLSSRICLAFLVILLGGQIKNAISTFSDLYSLSFIWLSQLANFSTLPDIFERKPTIEEIEFILNKLDLSPIKLREKLKTLPKLTKITKVPGEILDLTSFGKIAGTQITESGKITESLQIKTSVPVKSVEIGREQIKSVVEKYIENKSKTNKQINSSNTIKAIHKILNLEEGDIKWDDEIWAFAINIGKRFCVRHTLKTIYFE